MAAPDEIIGATAGAFEVVDRIELYVNRYFARKDVAADNIGVHSRLVEQHEAALQLIAVIVHNRAFHRVSLVPVYDEYIRSRLHSMRSQLQTNAERLKTLSVEINKAGVMTRVWRVNNILENCGKDVAEFHSFLTGTVIPLLRESDPSDQSVSEQYVPGSNVPPNPPRLTFDYNTKETCEGRLKAAILEGSSSGVVGIVASGLGGVGKTCALRGLAKDTDIRERFADGIFYIQLGNDVRISDVVNGLADAVETTGGNQLSRKVRRSPTVLEASKKANPWFKPRKCLFLVDDIWWVNGITSTVFEDLGIVLHDESLLVYTTRDKRFLRGADKKVSFEARAARGYIAERMLRTHAGLGTDVELSSESREAFDGILNICRGLPLAIGVAGATVSMYENRRKMNTEEAWLCYYRNLITKEENIIGERADRYGELRLIVDSSLDVLSTERRFSRPLEEMFRGFCILRKQQRVTGQVLQKLWNLVELREARQVAEKFDEVSLLQITESWNAFYVQLHDLVLEIAWHKASYRNEVKGWFGTLIDNYFPNGQDGNVEHGSALDDVTRDPSRLRRDFNRCLRVLRTWTRLCFSRNQPDIQKVAETSGRECAFRPWWSIDDDGFIHDNLCRALQRSGQEKELLWLLERARWVVIRLQKGGIGGVDDDLGIGLRVAKKNAVDGTEIVRYLKLIGSAARLSFMAVVENAYESWFQMYARVAWFANHCPRTQKFLSEICEHAPRPWVKPSVGFLDQAGGLVLETLHVKGCVAVLSICHGGDMIRILWIDSDGVGFVTDYEKRYGSRETHMLGSVQVRNNSSGNGQNAVSVQDGMSSESDRCMCGAFSDDLKTLVTGYSYILFTESDKSIAGKVLVWDIAAGFKIKNFLQTPCDAHKVGISGSGRKVACSLKDGRIFVWDTYRETGAGNPLEVLKVDEELKTLQLSYDGNRLLCCSDLSSNEGFYVWDSDYGRELVLPGEMQSDDVQCAAISRDSRLVVSGSMDGTIRIWNVDSTERAVHIINGHALVREIVLTPDGKRILSCADDHTMRVWDAESLVMIGQPLEMVWINRVAVSADGNEVVFNVSVDTIRVFSIKNMDTTIRSESYLGRVNCVAWCGRGKRLVTGSRDGFVRMWDAESGVRIGQPLEGHTRAVVCVAVSADGNRIVCGSEDGFVRIWDAISREAVAEPFSPVEGDEASSIASVAVNESGTRVVFCFRGRIYLWDVDGGGARTVTRDARHDSCVAISADGARLAFFSSVVSATVWDVDTKGSTVVGLTLSGHTGYLRSVTFSGDGKRLVCGSWDGTVRVWDVTSGEAIREPFAHDYQVVHLQSDVHGSRVASYDNRGNGKLWDVTRREYVMTSFDDEWASTLHSLEVEDISWNVQPTEFWKVVGRIGVKHEQTLASTERCLVRVGDIYYSEAHGSAFWPSCRIVR